MICKIWETSWGDDCSSDSSLACQQRVGEKLRGGKNKLDRVLGSVCTCLRLMAGHDGRLTKDSPSDKPVFYLHRRRQRARSLYCFQGRSPFLSGQFLKHKVLLFSLTGHSFLFLFLIYNPPPSRTSDSFFISKWVAFNHLQLMRRRKLVCITFIASSASLVLTLWLPRGQWRDWESAQAWPHDGEKWN